MSTKKSLSLYIHIPFCKKRCGYCDFNTYAGMEAAIPAYLDALKDEIDHFSEHIGRNYRIDTIYFGGGTPSLVSAIDFSTLLEHIKKLFNSDEKVEITMEANPNGITQNYLSDIHAAGMNRVSIGMQSVVPQELEALDRRHEHADVIRSVEFARCAGFENVNLDLIYGIPGQTMATLQKSVDAAISLTPNHLSIYGLILHEETALYEKIADGAIPPVDEDLAADMYAWLMEYLENNGYQQYEISNWAKQERDQSKHNLQYWRNMEYLGIGAGAHSHIGNNRWQNTPGIKNYIEAIQVKQSDRFFHPACEDVTQLDYKDDVKETMMMGLRLTMAGISLESMQTRFGIDIEFLYSEEIEKLIGLGLIELTGNREGEKILRLTKRGRMLGNQVFLEFI